MTQNNVMWLCDGDNQRLEQPYILSHVLAAKIDRIYKK